jgi:acyl transferase domain-containing protein/acyl-CoA synthetase (AMP-forming)/AMP-acid ligase II/acyl carrier protein
MIITGMLRERVAHQPSHIAFRFLRDGTEDQTLTFLELDTQARAIAGALQGMTESGERVLLLYPPGLAFVTAFFGCLYAGTVGVPTPAPGLDRPIGRLRAIVADAQPRIVLTTAALRQSLNCRIAEAPEFAALRWHATDEVLGDHAGGQETDFPGDALAYLQYTSGSTNAPKGVMITHENLAHNLEIIHRLCRFTENTPLVFWLPHYHDMGLNAVLLPVNSGCPLTLMAPASFVQRPYRWLHAISKMRGTHSAAPNSAYDLCVKAISTEQRATLDLSCWRMAFNGAEPVRAETLERFATAFAPCGFRREAFVPAYGLAEACLFVSGSKNVSFARTVSLRQSALQEDHVSVTSPRDKEGVALVSCGRPAEGLKLHIVDPESRRICRSDRIGEIWVSGSSVALGYWNRSGETAHTFGGYLSDNGEGPFLRTGDLGFVNDNELFVTGRLKDLLIIWGRNHYPQDLELAVEGCHSALRSGAVAAFSVEIEGGERPVIVAEVTRHFDEGDAMEVVRAIRQAVAEAHEVELHAVRLLRWGTLPITSSGKVRRSDCRLAFLADELSVAGEWTQQPRDSAAGGAERGLAETSPAVAEAIAAWMITRVAQETGMVREDVDVRRPFATLGLDSLSAVRLIGELEQRLGQTLSPTLVYDHPNIAALAAHLDPSAARPTSQATASIGGEQHATGAGSIAIIGIGCRFPGASGPAAFWRMLREGGDAIREVPANRWDVERFYDPRPMTPGKMNTRWGGFLERIDLFDPSAFNISPREAASMDPQQRLLLEVAWEALEDAGQTRDNLAGTSVGVFIGISGSEYGALQIAAPERIDAYWSTGNAMSIAANRVSYFFDLRGPSAAIDTACSSSLVAIHLACQSLRHGESTMALVGGVSLILTPTITVNFSMGGGTSPDGRCKAFDAGANGMVRGEGAGVVVLKPLDRALADGDPIYAVIRGSAVNQDGSTNGIVAPSREAQESVLRSACRSAGIRPGLVQYVEAHGTGTFLGDPIEAMALGNVLGNDRAEGETCAIGSVKSNIGHLEAAAGIASLIKVALALKHREIPPSLHFRKPNPHIAFETLRLRVQQSLSPWPETDGAATAGVSSFGFGGTNAHVVLQAVPSRPPSSTGQQFAVALLLPLSAHNGETLRSLMQAYLEESRRSLEAVSLGDLCYTASVRRTHHDHRAAVVFSSREDLVSRLESFVAGKNPASVATGRCLPGRAPRVAFVFSGHGSQWWAMGRALLTQEPVFRTTVQACDELLRPYAGWSLLQELEAEESCSCLGAGAKQQPSASLEVSQVALFAVQVALVEVWKSWGVQPAAVVGHSMGEVAAAYVAGALSLADALRVIFHRSHLMQEGLNAESASGAMALVRMSRAEAQEAVSGYEGRLALAAHNAPQVTLLSGEEAALREVLQSLKQRGIASRLAHVPGAGHCPQIEPLRGRLVALLDGENGSSSLRSRAAAIPIFSTVTGRKEPGEAFDARYWGRNMREPVFFAEAIAELAAADINYFLEISPDPLLISSIQQCLRHAEREGKALPSLRRGESDRAAMLEALAVLYADGYPVDWRRLYPHEAPCISLPSYPWQRQRSWLPRAAFVSFSATTSPSALIDDASDASSLDDAMYHLEWELAPADNDRNNAQAAAPPAWLLFSDHGPAGRELRERLVEAGEHCWTVSAGDDYRQFESHQWEIDPTQPEHFRRLLAETAAPGRLRGIVYLWSLDAAAPGQCTVSSLERAQDLGCVSVLHLVQALAGQNQPQPSRLWLVTAGSQRVEADTGAVAIAQAPLWALGRVILFEHPELRCRMVDLSPAGAAAEIPALVRELRRDDGEDHVALRGGARYRARLARGISPAQPQISISDSVPDFGSDGTYLVTGGLGGLGLTMARWMVEKGARHLALLARRSPSPEATALIASLEKKGAAVRVFAADVISEEEVDRVLSEIRSAMPPLRGIIHATAHLDDGLLRQLNRERFRSVMAPKLAGAWNLHVQTLADQLDFFVMFSSVASLLGSPGQANYAAANAFLDALAHYRASIGLPSLSVNWGPWAGVGGAARADRGGRLAYLGFGSIAPEQGVAALGCLLREREPQVAVMPVNWRRVRKAYPSTASWPLLARQWKHDGDALSWMPDDQEEHMGSAPLARTQPSLSEDFVAPSTPMEEKLAVIWMEVTGVTRVSVHDNFLKLGGDSLMAVQLLSKVSAVTCHEVSGQLLISNPTIASLAKALEDVPQPNSNASLNPVPATGPNTDFRIEHRPLLSLFASGNIAPVKGAALCYLAKSYLDRAGLTGDEVANNWCHNLPGYIARMETSLGPIALILLPMRESQLYGERETLVTSIVEGLTMAKQVGAGSVSLMGLLPSASDYGRDVAAAIGDRKDLPMITTGHATTAAAVVLNLVGILERAGRDLSGEQVAYLGLGSVGMATLRLMLKCLPQPSRLLLCDVYAKRDSLEQIRREVIAVWGDADRVRVVESGDQLPDEFYEASLIIGATNAPGVVDIARVKPGTILVDDSAPHCFTTEPAVRRFEESKDILFTEGGMMRSPQPIGHLLYVPRRAQPALQSGFLSRINSFNIPGCILSSLLSFDSQELKPTVGLVDVANSVRHYETLGKLGFQAADLHCEDYVLVAEAVSEFRRRFGR